MTILIRIFFAWLSRQSLVACDPVDVRNARNAVIEALPHMLSSMALLWGVVIKEEFQRRTSDSAQSSRHTSTSVYFKCTKVRLCIGLLFILYVFLDLVMCLHVFQLNYMHIFILRI